MKIYFSHLDFKKDLCESKKTLWSSSLPASKSFSIPEYLEKNYDTVLTVANQWIGDLPSRKLSHDESLIQFLDVIDGPSFWWMTLISERSSVAKTEFPDFLKLIAFLEICQVFLMKMSLSLLVSH